MTHEDLIETVARAICVADGCDPNSLFEGSPIWDHWMDDAKAAIAAMQPHIEAQREDAARMALEAAADECKKYAAWHDQHDDGLSGFDYMALGGREVTDVIRAIDPAQFRRPGDADL